MCGEKQFLYLLRECWHFAARVVFTALFSPLCLSCTLCTACASNTAKPLLLPCAERVVPPVLEGLRKRLERDRLMRSPRNLLYFSSSFLFFMSRSGCESVGCGVKGGGMLKGSVSTSAIQTGRWSEIELVISSWTVPTWCRCTLEGRAVCRQWSMIVLPWVAVGVRHVW